MEEEKPKREVKSQISGNILSHKNCDSTFKNVLRGKPEDV